MSLERTALRLSTVMMLANGFAAPYPTMAAGRVFDSRIDSVQIGAAGEVLPVITVCTDEEMGKSLSTNNGGPPFEEEVTLSIDLAIGIGSESGDELMFAQTEAELELNLDLLEAQVKRLLQHRPGIWGNQFNRVARRITNLRSERFVQPDANIRIAARQLTLSVLLPVDNTFGALVTINPAGGSAPPVVPEPFGGLLTTIIEHVPSYAATAEAIQAAITGSGLGSPIVMPVPGSPAAEVESLRIVEDERDGQNRPTTARPNGVADIPFNQN